MEFFIIALLIIANGLLSMSEIALVALQKSALQKDAQSGDKSAQIAIKLSKNPDKFFSTVQIGITLIGILTGIYSGDALGAKFADVLVSAKFPPASALFASQTIIVIAATYLTLIFGELVPKRIGLAHPEKVAKFAAKPMALLSTAAAPVVFILSKSTALILKILGVNSVHRKVTESEIKSMVKEGEKNGEVQKVERNIVERVFWLGDRFIESIMTPRNEIIKIDANLSNSEIEKIVVQHPHTVYPVSNGSLDELLGFVLIEELFGKLSKPEFSIKDVLRPIEYFKRDTMVYDALERLREKRIKSAIISNEFGVTLGIVTLNDIMDAVLGDMPEKNEEENIIRRSDGTFLVCGQCPFHDFLLYFDLENIDENYNTIGGLVLEKLGRIPKTGEKIFWREFTIEVIDMDGARIDKLFVTHTIADFQN